MQGGRGLPNYSHLSAVPSRMYWLCNQRIGQWFLSTRTLALGLLLNLVSKDYSSLPSSQEYGQTRGRISALSFS